MPPVPNVKGFPGVYSDDILSSCEIKDIFGNTKLRLFYEFVLVQLDFLHGIDVNGS